LKILGSIYIKKKKNYILFFFLNIFDKDRNHNRSRSPRLEASGVSDNVAKGSRQIRFVALGKELALKDGFERSTFNIFFFFGKYLLFFFFFFFSILKKIPFIFCYCLLAFFAFSSREKNIFLLLLFQIFPVPTLPPFFKVEKKTLEKKNVYIYKIF